MKRIVILVLMGSVSVIYSGLNSKNIEYFQILFVLRSCHRTHVRMQVYSVINTVDETIENTLKTRPFQQTADLQFQSRINLESYGNTHV